MRNIEINIVVLSKAKKITKIYILFIFTASTLEYFFFFFFFIFLICTFIKALLEEIFLYICIKNFN